jgi:hypothetical protein
MPEKRTVQRARKAKRAGKSPSTQAGEFVREEIHHVREGKHGARSTEQAIAIGLSKARRAGVALPAPRRGSRELRKQAARDSKRGRRGQRVPSARRSRGVLSALQHEGHAATSSAALSQQARRAAARRGATDRKRAAQRAVRTKGPVVRRRAARQAARTRARRAKR